MILLHLKEAFHHGESMSRRNVTFSSYKHTLRTINRRSCNFWLQRIEQLCLNISPFIVSSLTLYRNLAKYLNLNKRTYMQIHMREISNKIKTEYNKRLPLKLSFDTYSF